jgi:hypothetical protein
MGIVKNRFGPRQCHTVLEIDYDTLSLKDPDDVAKSFSVKTPKKQNMSIDGELSGSVVNTLDLIESLSLDDEN